NTNVDWSPRLLYAAIPRADVAKAVLRVDTNLVKTRIPAARLAENSIYSETHPHGLTLTASRYLRQPDHPLPLRRRAVRFSADVLPDHPGSVLHLRVVTVSGRIFHGPLVLLPGAPSAAVALPVWSDTRKGPVEVSVDARRVPDIEYVMDPRHGSALCTPAGRSFWGHDGGYTDSVTGRGGDGGLDGSPFVDRKNYPEGAVKMAPDWVVEDGRHCLLFDGVGTFVALPQGVLPRRGPFTLAFEIKPLEVSKPQVLFAHHGHYVGSLTVQLEGGRLAGRFVNQDLEKFTFTADRPMQPNVWTRVTVVYDLTRLRAWLDGVETANVPCRGPGLYDTPSVFGGFGGKAKAADEFVGNTGWFKGHLRALRVIHRRAPP
ncbi:MAG: LamG domain-containing protein, partial [Planctomycetes bacterium]|nr:LamG domain-containing protein [Planctomycetota bacterium]